MNFELLKINTHYAEEKSMGGLSILEAGIDFPFEIKRIYYIYGSKENTLRGYHAHKALKQVMFCPYGKIRIVLDDGKSREEVLLSSPSVGLVVYPCLWRTIEYLENNSVLCVAASEHYDESDYIRDYDEFIKYVNA